MTITFRVEDGHDPIHIPNTIINADQLGALRDRLAEDGAKLGLQLIVLEYGVAFKGGFGFEARICPVALAAIASCFDHDPAVVAILDEAQFRGRRIRIWQLAGDLDIWLGLASSPDSAPELEVTNSNAYALLELLGLVPDSFGEIPMAELRRRLTDPRVPRQLDVEPGLARYLPTLAQMAAVKAIDGDLKMAWA